MKNKSLLFVLAVFTSLAALPRTYAHCPLCTAAAGAGVAAARAYGISDSIVGLFLGAFIISSALWFNKWLKKKVTFPLQETLIVLVTFLLLAVPFYLSGIITDVNLVKAVPEQYSILGIGVLGIDKLLFGMILGSLAIWGAFSLSDYIKKKRGRVLYPYQSISFMLITLTILTIVLLLIPK